MRWIINQNAVTQLGTVGISPALLATFDNAGNYSNDRADLPRSTFCKTYPSFAALQSASLPSGLQTVLYDLEKWAMSPLAEQKDPVAAARACWAWCQSKGLQMLFTPAIDLIYVVAPPGSADKYQAFLNTGLYTAMAPWCDVIEIQAQQLQGDDRFAGFVAAALAQIRAGNPTVPVFVGLSSMPLGNAVEAWQIVRDYNRTKGSVQGYWINTPVQSAQCPTCGDGNPQAMLDAITQIIVDT